MKGARGLALFLIVLAVFSVTSCTIERVERNERDVEVIFIGQEIKEYIRRARSGESDWDKLYRALVMDPITEYLQSRDSHIVLENYHQPIYDLEELERQVDLVEAQDIEGLVKTALATCNKHIRGVSVRVYILINDPEDTVFRDMMNGARGVTGLYCSTIVLQVNPTAPRFKETLPYTLAHEYHHAVFGLRGSEGSGAIDTLLMEGRADSFAHLVFPEVKAPWTSACSPEQERAVWYGQVKDHLADKGLEVVGAVLRDEYWSGYTIAFHIVQCYLRTHPGVSVDDWTGMSPWKLFSESGYEEWLGN